MGKHRRVGQSVGEAGPGLSESNESGPRTESANGTTMLRLFFILANFVMAALFFFAGIAAYINWDGTWDAGVLPLFFAVWFILAGLGFWFKNVWIVGMASVALIGTSLLCMFIFALGELQENFGISKAGVDSVLIGLGLIFFVTTGQIYALWSSRPSSADPPKTGPR